MLSIVHTLVCRESFHSLTSLPKVFGTSLSLGARKEDDAEVGRVSMYAFLTVITSLTNSDLLHSLGHW